MIACTYSVVPESKRRLVKHLIREADVCAEERFQGDTDAAFTSPDRIRYLKHNVQVLMVLVPRGTETTPSQQKDLETLVRQKKAQLGLEVKEDNAVQTLRTFFEPKSFCKGHQHGRPHT